MREDLLYLNEHHKRVDSILGRIIGLRDYSKNILSENIKPVEGSKFLSTIQYKDLDTWGFNGSNTIDILVDKLVHMVVKGDIINVYPLLNSICSNKIKKQTRPRYTAKSGVIYGAEFLGYGHFRLNCVCFTLTKKELEIVKDYFGL